MTKDEYDHLKRISDDRFRANIRLAEYLEGVELEEEEPKGTYTTQQRKAAWKYMGEKAQQLNDAGLDQRKFLKPGYDIPWTAEAFHDHVWIPVQKAMFSTDSMRELKKGQVSEVHKVIEREIGEKHSIEYLPFPSNDARHLTELGGYKTQAGSDYDPALGLEDYKGQPNF